MHPEAVNNGGVVEVAEEVGDLLERGAEARPDLPPDFVPTVHEPRGSTRRERLFEGDAVFLADRVDHRLPLTQRHCLAMTDDRRGGRPRLVSRRRPSVEHGAEFGLERRFAVVDRAGVHSPERDGAEAGERSGHRSGGDLSRLTGWHLGERLIGSYIRRASIGQIVRSEFSGHGSQRCGQFRDQIVGRFHRSC
jgi:hypothetical protein